MERLSIAARSYINCLTSLTLTMFMERHQEQKRGINPFLYFFLSFWPPHLWRDRERGREKEVEQNLNEVGNVGEVRNDRQRKMGDTD